MRRAKGFTLLETVVSVGIFSVLIVFIFYAFSMVTAIFQDTDVRQSIENQMKSIKLLIQRDLEMGDFWFINAVSRPQVNSTFRDGVAVGTLANWNDSAQYDVATGRPAWNRYVVWYASQEDPGRLFRQVVEEAAGVPLLGPYASLGTNLSEDPNSNASLLYTRTLSNKVKNFRVIPRLQNGTVAVSVSLEGLGAKRVNSQENTLERISLDLVYRPRNTWPKI